MACRPSTSLLRVITRPQLLRAFHCARLFPSPVENAATSIGTPSLRPAAASSLTQRPTLASVYGTTFRRAFSQSPRSRIRPQYYRDGRGSQSAGQTLRQRIDSIDPTFVLFAIIIANAVVYACWQYGQTVYQRFRDPSWLLFLQDNFTSSWRNISSGRMSVQPALCLAD